MSSTNTSCLEIAKAVASHQTTARAVVDTSLAAAEKHQDAFRAFIRITPELARRQAEEVDRRLGRGERLPLAGVPFAVKDLFDVEGLPTTCGSRAFADHVPKSTATSVQKLLAAGGVLIGKLNLHECAFGFTGVNATYGDCKNPWNKERIAGGSSSGSALAVALGICPLALASDTGGSIRQPSALCGITGIKPTYGRVSRSGVAALSWTLDHVGPMTRTAAEAALALEIMAGHDPLDESTSRTPVPKFSQELAPPIRNLRLGVPKNWFFDSVEPDVAKAVAAAIAKFQELGTKRVDVELPYLEEVVGAHRAIIFPEASSYHQPHVIARVGLFAPDILPLLQAGLAFSAVDYLKGQRVRRTVRRAWTKVFEQIDILVTPTAPLVATRFGQQMADLPGGQKTLVRAYLDATLPFNLSGQPAMSIPCGFSAGGLPIGLQLVGKPLAESTILRAAHQFQLATDWHKRVAPPARPA